MKKNWEIRMGLLDGTEPAEQTFGIFGGLKTVQLRTFTIYCAVLSVLASMGQQVFMPMLLTTFGGGTGNYTVVLTCSIIFNLVFWPIVLYRYLNGLISKKTTQFNKSWKSFMVIMAVGCCDGANGILTVFASDGDRVPPPLQPILLQFSTIFTLVLSKYMLDRKYNLKHYLAVLGVFVGIVISMIPTFIQIGDGVSLEFQNGWAWGLILIVATIPGVLMNILEEQVFDDIRSYDIYLFLAYESLFQVLFVGAFFWSDIIPGFGTSTSISSWSENFANGFKCMFGNELNDHSYCDYTMLLIILFSLAYCGTYVYSAYLIKHASANFNAFIATIGSPLSTIFWILVPAATKWAQGPNVTGGDMLAYLVATVVIVPSSFYFRRYELEDKRNHLAEMGSEF